MSLHPERIVPAETSIGVIEHHLAKYRFALEQDLRSPTLDAACGVGYATAFLAESGAHPAVGVDISGEAMETASKQYGSIHGVTFARSDVTRLPFPDNVFGSVVGFETVEHVPDQERYLREVRRVLRRDGCFVCSTPYVPTTDTSPANPFHVLELDPSDFCSLLGRHFGQVELFSQIRMDTNRARGLRRLDVLGLRRRLPPQLLALAGKAAGTPPTSLRQASDFAIVAGVQAATEVLAVCR